MEPQQGEKPDEDLLDFEELLDLEDEQPDDDIPDVHFWDRPTIGYSKCRLDL